MTRSMAFSLVKCAIVRLARTITKMVRRILMSDEWKRSSFCANSTCVWVRTNTNGDRLLQGESDEVIRIPAEEWAAFIAGVKAGEFDDE